LQEKTKNQKKFGVKDGTNLSQNLKMMQEIMEQEKYMSFMRTIFHYIRHLMSLLQYLSIVFQIQTNYTNLLLIKERLVKVENYNI
jgi:hypothetical protein